MYKWTRALGLMNGEKGFMRPTRVSYRVLYATLFTLIVVLIVLLLPSNLKRGGTPTTILLDDDLLLSAFNTTYPLTPPHRLEGGGVEFRIGLVADDDEKSKVADESTWVSYLKTGCLTLSSNGRLSVSWDPEVTTLYSHISEKGRGAELSELVVFNGKLYTVDDRSGIVYEVRGEKLVPWVILEDGPGNVAKGFKAEWMTVKGHLLYIGGLGKEWTSKTGEYINDHPQYIKVVSGWGHMEHRPWASVYTQIKEAAGITNPGYVIHESACWSKVHKRWFFLPRRASKESYDDVEDEHRATNLIISADESFSDISVSHIGPFHPTRGYSSFRFVPGTQDSIILAIKSEEVDGKIASYMLAFDLHGDIRMPEQKVADLK